MKLCHLFIVLLIQFISIQFVNGQDKSTIPSKPFRVVIERMDSTTITGILEEIKDSSLVVRLKSNNDFSLSEISYSNIALIKLRRTGKIGRGALIGFGSGALIGGITGAILYNPPEENPLINLIDETTVKPAAIAAGIITGGIAGTLIGGAVGTGNSTYFINGIYKNYQLQKSEIIQLVTGL